MADDYVSNEVADPVPDAMSDRKFLSFIRLKIAMTTTYADLRAIEIEIEAEVAACNGINTIL